MCSAPPAKQTVVHFGYKERRIWRTRPAPAGIGWHRDAPMFGPVVVGTSFGASATTSFRRDKVHAWKGHDQVLAPRSLYAIGGAARKEWQHSIPPFGALVGDVQDGKEEDASYDDVSLTPTTDGS